MKKVLVGLFYTLQGLIHLGLFFIIRVVGSPGAPGGVLYGLEIIIRSYFVLASCFSFLTALTLFSGRQNSALNLGIITSVLFGLFYVFLITGSSSNIQRGYYVYHYSILLMVSLIIVVLNVVSVFGLYRLAKDKRI